MGRSVHLTASGASPSLEVVNTEKPVPKAGEVVVRMTFAPVNPADVFSIAGVYPGFTPAALPAVPGLEGAGVVDSVGAGVTSLAVGQRVVPFLIFGDGYTKAGNGSWQEYIAVAPEHCFPVPDAVSDEHAAQLVVNPFTAWSMLKALAVPAGEYVLQTAAGSVLGRQFIQMAKHTGVKTINIVRRREQAAELLALGADYVISTDEDIVARVKEITGGRGAYGGIDAVAGDGVETLTSSIRAGGTLFMYGAMSGLTFKGSVIDSLFRDVKIKGFWVTPFATAIGIPKCHELANELWPLFTAGVVVPFTGQVFDLAQVNEAVAASKTTARGGKVLLKF